MKNYAEFPIRFPSHKVVVAASGLAFAMLLVGCGGKNNAAGGATPVAARTVASEKASTPQEIELAEAPIPQSIFSTVVTDGRDPFFPDSVRRLPRMAVNPVQAPVHAAPKALPSFEHLKLNGLYPVGDRPLALINRTPMSEGEEAKVAIVLQNGASALESRKILVRCLEVRQNSVVISVEGEPGTKELFLKSRL